MIEMRLESEDCREMYHRFFESGYYTLDVSERLSQSGICPKRRDDSTITYCFGKMEITMYHPRGSCEEVVMIDCDDMARVERVKRLLEHAIGIRFRIIE